MQVEWAKGCPAEPRALEEALRFRSIDRRQTTHARRLAGYRSGCPPCLVRLWLRLRSRQPHRPVLPVSPDGRNQSLGRSEEHTSELQSLTNLVCRLLLE